jgi:hypothetical protein
VSRLATLPALLLAGVMLSACYDARSTRVQLRTPGSNLDCFETADRVFSGEGFVASTDVHGVNRFYSPKTPGDLALGWGIAVAIQDRPTQDSWGQCGYELEALSPEEGCGMQCPLTPAPGQQFKEMTLKMARLLDQAFGQRAPQANAQ